MRFFSLLSIFYVHLNLSSTEISISHRIVFEEKREIGKSLDLKWQFHKHYVNGNNNSEGRKSKVKNIDK